MHEIIKMSTLSAGDIGRHLGISRQFVNQWTNGISKIPPAHKGKLYELLLKTFLSTIEEQRYGLRLLEESIINLNQKGENEESK